ncbi:MAG TPA: hypothetical protein VFG88_07690 [Nocardioidaceae bacterium]|nr:hypothetical protein [Nocardioidaceae bacterium]
MHPEHGDSRASDPRVPSLLVGAPLSDEQRARLRLEVGRLRQRDRRRRFDPEVHLGAPGVDSVALRLRGGQEGGDALAMDAALRTDLAARLVGAAARADTAWLVRPGAPEPHDLDLAWLAALRMATGMHGLVLARFFAVTRYGWLDVVSGERRVWKRLRL